MNKYVVASKSFRNSLLQFTGFAALGKFLSRKLVRHLRNAVRRKHPEKWRTNSWCLLQDNAPAHRSVVVKDFLAKNNVTTLEHPPYSPDPAPGDFYLFPRLKSALKERSVFDATDIIKNATEELRRLSRYGFQECFQDLYNRW